MNVKQISDFVRGQGNPTYTTLLRLSRGLHVSPGRLMTLADELRERDSRR
jgi:transcriptional regulator with XRE-family HTH domain